MPAVGRFDELSDLDFEKLVADLMQAKLELPSPSPPNKLICSESLPSAEHACPAVPCSGLMKEILGKLMGL